MPAENSTAELGMTQGINGINGSDFRQIGKGQAESAPGPVTLPDAD
jgi:hypothetical protein